jgi:site-specific recombinase XerD
MNFPAKTLHGNENDSDKLFVSACGGSKLENVLHKLIEEVNEMNPQVIHLYHLRTSVITHWINEYGLMETMIKAGHLHLVTTKKYETVKYDELHEQLKSIHPLECIAV